MSYDKKEYMRQYQKSEWYKNYQKEYKKRNRKKLNAQSAAWSRMDRKRNPEKWALKTHRDKLLQRYGLTTEEYQKMYADQRGRCGICQKTEDAVAPKSYKLQRLAVDHDHQTQLVRGLLCFSCNRALGYFKDDAHNLISALIYLEAAQTQRPATSCV